MMTYKSAGFSRRVISTRSVPETRVWEMECYVSSPILEGIVEIDRLPYTDNKDFVCE